MDSVNIAESAQSGNWNKSKELKPSRKIKIISPAGPVDEKKLSAGIEKLKSWGYEVFLSAHVLNRNGYLSASDEIRLSELFSALIDPDIDSIICSRGGYGSMRLLPSIQWDVLENATPKLFIGFSDLGAFQVNLWKRCNWVSFSGPQAAAIGGFVDQDSIDRLRLILENPARSISINDVSLISGENLSTDYHFLPICLTVLTSLIGTKYMPDLNAIVLCLEDINEPLYKIDRMLWQLIQSDAVNKLAGLVIGKFVCNNKDISSSVINLVLETFKIYSIPIWAGMKYGHVEDTYTLPVGGKFRFTNDQVILNI